MKKNYLRKVLLLSSLTILCLFVANSSFGQAEYQEINNSPAVQYKGANTSNPNEVTLQTQNRQSSEAIALTEKIQRLRASNSSPDIAELRIAQQQLADLNGLRTAPYEIMQGATLVAGNASPIINPSPATVNNIMIADTDNNFVKGIATTTEQIGANVGRIWTVYGKGASGTDSDSLFFSYSDDHGSTWTSYAYVFFNSLARLGWDDLDVEIVENATGDKFIYTVYGYVEDGTNNKRIGCTVLNITTFAGIVTTLSWAGDVNNQYYGARVTSDNAYWTSQAYIYIVASYDSSLATHCSQKIVQVTSPFTVAPVFTYKDDRIFWFSSQQSEPLLTDVAYLRNGTTDSLIVSFSGANNFAAIFFTKFSIFNYTALNSFSYEGSAPDPKTYARLASTGQDDGSVLCVFNQTTAGNKNVKYFRSTGYGQFAANPSTFQSILWGSTTVTSQQPDIVAVRNSNRYYFSFNEPTGNISHVSVTSAGATSQLQPVNAPGITVSGLQGSKPGFTYNNNDSCFVAFGGNGPWDVWVALGCSGPPVNTTGIAQLDENAFSLGQNYPNPALNYTVITYNLTESSNAMLTVYDVHGNLIKQFKNENQNAGLHEIKLNLSDFASGVYTYSLTTEKFNQTRQMIIIK